MISRRAMPAALGGLLLLGTALIAAAQTGSNIRESKHNLSAAGPGTVVAVSESQVCVFCHTPHGATTSPGTPLWNRQFSTQTYTPYTSSSLDAETIGGQLDQPAGSSKLCLSCHDGSLAIGTVNVIGGLQNQTIAMTGVGPGGEMPPGAGTDTGFTRNLGTDLTNDHPISLTYDTTLAGIDGELRDPAATTDIGLRSPGVRPLFPLEPTGAAGESQLQCISCHDPHLPDPVSGPPRKFLRANRLQQVPPTGTFDAASDIVCLGCHDKEGWNISVHASSSAADETYVDPGASLREIPAGTPVWQAACLNCHDTHTVHGARRLLREGTDSTASPKSGGNSAIEETCYQCHGPTPIVDNTAGEVQDVESDFSLARHMPITTLDQQATAEVHDIVDADTLEPRTALGRPDVLNRHAECTDCHNPHRAMKNALFNGTGVGDSTHEHAPGHTNIASGALAGTWGVEPIYGDGAFLALPAAYDVKQGVGVATDANAPHVTREYQVCLKCHSDYGYNDDGLYPTGSRPDLDSSGGGTPAGTNNLQQYTNQAMEFQAPIGDMGAPGSNHRSWHPVIAETGRDAATRNMSASTNLFLAPWNGANIGSQTMYCSDCHGSNTANGTAVPTGDNPWGPHGSNNDFILKGTWSAADSQNASTICFRCHNRTNYATDTNEGDRSGFESGFGGGGAGDTNLHAFHAKRVGQPLKCNWCHVAVPHGWKNKAFLVNLNDVGPEAGLPPGTEVSITGNGSYYNQGPYYMDAKLKIRTFATSGNWQEGNCGSNGTITGQQGVGRDWMRNVCNPPQ